MLLRRITTHVKEQNWFAVALDFVIVVVGVFVGLQVQEWAEEQDRRNIETAYTVRLHDEVINLQATRKPRSDERRQTRDDMATATALIFGDDDRALTVAECQSIVFSYIISNPTDDLASLLELQSSGGLSLIQNEDLLAALRAFSLTRARARDSRVGIVESTVELSSIHPLLIQVLSPTLSEEQPDWSVYQCDVEGMRNSPAFLNDYEINQSNYQNHLRDINLVNESLANLHQVLDEVLGVTHEEAE